MKSTVRVAAAQMAVNWMQPATNVATICAMLDNAGRESADLVVFPELVSGGFITPRDHEFMREYLAAAVDVPGPFTQEIGEAVRRAGCYAIVGVTRRHSRIPAVLFNSTVLFTPDGAITHVYDKTHIPSEEKHYFVAGSSLEVIPTDLGMIGMLICADNSFPEAARTLALRGAEIIAVSYARPRVTPSGIYRVLAQARAFENQVFVVSSNRVGVESRSDHHNIFEGDSVIAEPYGDILADAPSEGPGLIFANLSRNDLDGARLWHTRYRDRRPDLYSSISNGRAAAG